ncbi:hypothetical protein B0H15DRAFT_540027 [Mycena belliarum]|uniref:DUF6534 domain-containing protein n=1 Tax=Mycena belliarum TaxID=1033014 RepID=A0AAD6TTS3_9AGAR|nr:hypothetical protein B0H15DRAFT_540027 [Mycena belliae]
MDSTRDLGNSIHLASSWLNIALYTLEISLCQRYLRNSSRPLVHRVAAAAMLLFDGLCTASLCVLVHLSLITIPNDPLSPRLLKPIAASIYMTYATALVEQYFMCTLYFHLTRNIFITGLLALCVLVHTAFSFASASLLLVENDILNIPAFTATTVGAITCAFTDGLIAISLCFKFWKLLALAPTQSTTRSLVQRIMMLTISSGLIVGSNTLIMMILLLKASPVFQLFFCLSRPSVLPDAAW